MLIPHSCRLIYYSVCSKCCICPQRTRMRDSSDVSNTARKQAKNKSIKQKYLLAYHPKPKLMSYPVQIILAVMKSVQ